MRRSERQVAPFRASGRSGSEKRKLRKACVRAERPTVAGWTFRERRVAARLCGGRRLAYGAAIRGVVDRCIELRFA
eukprot:1292499-Prymnesium_polylepis.1